MNEERYTYREGGEIISKAAEIREGAINLDITARLTEDGKVSEEELLMAAQDLGITKEQFYEARNNYQENQVEERDSFWVKLVKEMISRIDQFQNYIEGLNKKPLDSQEVKEEKASRYQEYLNLANQIVPVVPKKARVGLYFSDENRWEKDILDYYFCGTKTILNKN